MKNLIPTIISAAIMTAFSAAHAGTDPGMPTGHSNVTSGLPDSLFNVHNVQVPLTTEVNKSFVFELGDFLTDIKYSQSWSNGEVAHELAGGALLARFAAEITTDGSQVTGGAICYAPGTSGGEGLSSVGMQMEVCVESDLTDRTLAVTTRESFNAGPVNFEAKQTLVKVSY